MTTGWTVGDLEPPLTGTALGKVRSEHPELTDAEFNMLPSAPIPLNTATSVIGHIKRPDNTVITRAVERGEDVGSWIFTWTVGDLTINGTHRVEIEAHWPGERPRTFGQASFPVVRQIA